MSAEPNDNADGETAALSVPGGGTVSTDDPLARNELARNIRQSSAIFQRKMLSESLGMEYGGARDIYGTLGYPRDPSPQDFMNRYLRQDIARTIVDAPANTCWREFPNVQEPDSDGDEATTAFEEDIQRLEDDFRLSHYLERVDKLAGIGHYGVLVIGVDDGADDMEKPVDTSGLSSLDDLSYLSPFSQTRVEDIRVDDDPTSSRYGLPEAYKIVYDHDGTQSGIWTHYTRVIHVAEGLLEDEIHGRPRLEGVLNRLIDLEKVIGGAAEMTWRGADRKFAAKQAGDGQIANPDDMKDEVESLIHGLDPVAYLQNVELEAFEGETVDPSGIVDQLLKLISGETGIPQRILTGSERGELASTQDRATFYGRMQERQTSFCEPQVLRPLLDRLMSFGILSPPQNADDESADYDIEWPTLFELNAIEEAEVRLTNSKALKNAAHMGDTSTIATTGEIREQVMDWDPELGAESSGDADVPTDPDDDIPEDDDARDAVDDFLDPDSGGDGDGGDGDNPEEEDEPEGSA